MTFHSGGQPALALVDDDFHSARLLTRMLEAHGGPAVSRFDDPELALRTLADGSLPSLSEIMVVVDLKSWSSATGAFIERLRQAAPQVVIVAMAPSLDRDVRNKLLDAGAAAVFERHADITAYRREVANLVAFWVRNQRLDAVGT